MIWALPMKTLRGFQGRCPEADDTAREKTKVEDPALPGHFHLEASKTTTTMWLNPHLKTKVHGTVAGGVAASSWGQGLVGRLKLEVLVGSPTWKNLGLRIRERQATCWRRQMPDI